MKKPRTGWKRLGIAISLLWTAIVLVIASLEYAELQTKYQQLSFEKPAAKEFQIASHHIFLDLYRKRQFSYEQAIGAAPMYDHLVVNVGNTLMIWFGPVLAIWAVGAGLLWIADGFKLDKRR